MRSLFLLILTGLMISVNSCHWFVVKPQFDGQSAMNYLKKQCEIGPRNPGSEGHQKALEYMTEELRKYCDRVDHQKFHYTDKRDTTKKFELTNIIASINLNPKNKKRVLLCAHWDTRPWADKDPDPANRMKPIIGANDGASGVAVLLEMARTIKQQPLDIGVDIILFDLEDYGDHNWESKPDSLNAYCIGSEYFAKNNKTYFPEFAILLDMIGDKNLDLPIEQNSYTGAKDIVNKVWDAAKRLEKPAFRKTIESNVYDDHIPLLRIGIKCIDIIDFDYPDDSNRYHHTMDDTPDKCSAESLQQIGDVLVEVLYNE
ncbi:MAG TPA: M28 family peptidase [bacterium]|nr:M28 family peptidase [bacterium]HMW34290.1 M28 family peptidase [bacterium]HMY35495.1 M28 family peptidase [bacterium]HNB56475.1 M28 family peptidase [bacterium]HND77159.1 M28 family peptidase [bacterium]